MCLAVLGVSLSASAVTLKSSVRKVPLLELYTSEGCSSCPPAEAWLGTLEQDPGLWKTFVPVAFHVDYWDGLGWPDRFASEEFTQRQRKYAALWRSRSIYTPGFVYNGQEWRKWRSARTIPVIAGTRVGELSLKLENASVDAKFANLKPQKENALVLHFAVLGLGLSTKVKAGENRGRNLGHDFVVLNYSKHFLKKGKEDYAGTLSWPKVDKQGAKRLAIAAWVTSRGDPRPIQSVGGWYEPER